MNAPKYTSRYVKFGHYYGKKTFLLDSVLVDEQGKIYYADSVHAGIYLLITPPGNSYEFMIAETSDLNINIDKAEDQSGLEISGNIITEAFNSYLNQVRAMEIEIDSMKNLSGSADTYAEKIAIQRISKRLKDSINVINKKNVVKYDGTLLSNYLRALLPVKMPVIKIPSNISNPDSFRWVQSHTYFRKHYLDNISFSDNGLIYTPVLEDKVITYLTRIIEQEPKSITQAVDTILLLPDDPTVNQYLTELIMERYSRSKHKALDEYVYLHLIKDYYLAGKTPWANNRRIRLLTDEYNQHKPASLLQKAPEIKLPDRYGKQQSLSGIQSEYTLVIFWDYDCPYCRRAMEDVRKIIQNFEDQNIRVFTVFTGEDIDVWKAFLAKKIPNNWTNTRLDNNYSIPRLYNISQTPAIFLLSSDKTILNKNLTASTLNSYLEKNLY